MELSIIVPVYNVEKYVRESVKSIYKQQLDEGQFEVIIVNDGTTDRSMEMIQDIIEAHSNITVINQENLSLSVARNNGIAAARGEYIMMPDSDDLLIAGSVKPLLEKALETKADLVVADFIEMTDDEIDKLKTIEQPPMTVTEKTGEQLFIEDLNPRQCYVWRTLYRRQFLLDNELTFVPGIRYQDVPFTNKCYLKAQKCLRTNWLLNIYRRGHESATYSFNKKKAKELCIAIASTWSLKAMPDLSAEVQRKLNNNLFASFSLLIYFMLYGINSRRERKEIFKFLRKQVPDLHFADGMKQRVTSWLFNLSPAFYFTLRQLTKQKTPQPNFDFSS